MIRILLFIFVLLSLFSIVNAETPGQVIITTADGSDASYSSITQYFKYEGDYDYYIFNSSFKGRSGNSNWLVSLYYHSNSTLINSTTINSPDDNWDYYTFNNTLTPNTQYYITYVRTLGSGNIPGITTLASVSNENLTVNSTRFIDAQSTTTNGGIQIKLLEAIAPRITTNISNYYNSVNITIQLNTVSDTNMSYYLDGGAEVIICNDCNNSLLTLTGLAESNHTIILSSTNEYGQTNNTLEFVVDITPPSINNNIPSIARALYNFDFNSSCSDTYLDYCYIVVNSQNVSLNVSSFNFTTTGNLSYNIYGGDLAGNAVTDSGVVYVNPTQYIYFESSLGEELTNFTINGTLYVEYFNFSLYSYGIGTHTFNFSKSGFVDTIFDVTLSDTSEINTTEIITTSSVAMYVYSFPSLNPLMFNLSVEYNSTIDTYLNQNASIFFTYPDVPLGINRFVFSAPGYSENVLYQDIEATTDINISVYMFNSSATTTVTYTVQDVGGTALEGVLIEAQRIINSTYETISQTLTDASGSSFMLLDNTVSYKIILTKDGYVETVFYTIPSIDTYTIKMSEDEDEYEYVRDISYSFRPATNLINSNTTYSFSGFISGSGITVSAYTLYYDNGTILYSDSSTNPTGTTFSLSYTTPSNFSTDYLQANITYIKSGVTYNIMKQYELLDFNSDTVIGNLMVFGDDDTEEAQLTKWFILMAVSVIVFVIGAVFSSNISLLIVPVYAFFAYIGWIDWIIAAVAIFITLVVFVGGKLR